MFRLVYHSLEQYTYVDQLTVHSECEYRSYVMYICSRLEKNKNCHQHIRGKNFLHATNSTVLR